MIQSTSYKITPLKTNYFSIKIQYWKQVCFISCPLSPSYPNSPWSNWYALHICTMKFRLYILQMTCNLYLSTFIIAKKPNFICTLVSYCYNISVLYNQLILLNQKLSHSWQACTRVSGYHPQPPRRPQKHYPLFFTKPPLKSANCPGPFFRQSP